MDSTHTEVRQLIRILTPLLHTCVDPLSPQNIGNAFFGLQSMRNNNSEINPLINQLKVAMLASNINSLSGKTKTLDIGIIHIDIITHSKSKLTGYRKFRTLHIMLYFYTNYSCMQGQQIGMTLFGLRQMSLDHTWRPFLEASISRLKYLSRPLFVFSGDLAYLKMDVLSSYQHVTLVLQDDSSPFMYSVSRLRLLDELKTVQKDLGHKMNQVNDLIENTPKQEQQQSLTHANAIAVNMGPPTRSLEHRYIDIAEDLLSSLDKTGIIIVSTTRNEFLHGFEADLVIRFAFEKDCALDKEGKKSGMNSRKESDIQERVLNIEIDGPHHQMQSQKNFDTLRDKFLERTHGVKVVRLRLADTQLSLAHDHFREIFQNTLK